MTNVTAHFKKDFNLKLYSDTSGQMNPKFGKNTEASKRKKKSAKKQIQKMTVGQHQNWVHLVNKNQEQAL